MKVTPFSNDDDGYFAWLQKNPGGFVVQAQKGTPVKPIMLHRTRCSHISKEGLVKGHTYTKGDFLKVCAEGMPALRTWAQSLGRPTAGSLKECSDCHPTCPDPNG